MIWTITARRPSPARFFAFPAAFGFILALALAFALLPALPAKAAEREKLATRYLRGVYVMRQLYPGEHWPPVTIPSRIRTDDATNTLLKHQDAAFVLGNIAPALSAAALKGGYPAAGYYAAHALSRLGDHAAAAQAMRRYAAKTPLDGAARLFLLRELYAAGDYPAVRETARRWQALEMAENSCSEERLAYVWGSYFAEGLHRDAMEAVLSDPCASWAGQLFFARSSLALGHRQDAEDRLAAVFSAYPDKEREIHILWNKLLSAETFP